MSGDRPPTATSPDTKPRTIAGCHQQTRGRSRARSRHTNRLGIASPAVRSGFPETERIRYEHRNSRLVSAVVGIPFSRYLLREPSGALEHQDEAHTAKARPVPHPVRTGYGEKVEGHPHAHLTDVVGMTAEPVEAFSYERLHGLVPLVDSAFLVLLEARSAS